MDVHVRIQMSHYLLTSVVKIRRALSMKPRSFNAVVIVPTASSTADTIPTYRWRKQQHLNKPIESMVVN